jgi:hypothetical protein
VRRGGGGKKWCCLMFVCFCKQEEAIQCCIPHSLHIIPYHAYQHCDNTTLHQHSSTTTVQSHSSLGLVTIMRGC